MPSFSFMYSCEKRFPHQKWAHFCVQPFSTLLTSFFAPPMIMAVVCCNTFGSICKAYQGVDIYFPWYYAMRRRNNLCETLVYCSLFIFAQLKTTFPVQIYILAYSFQKHPARKTRNIVKAFTFFCNKLEWNV